ncbi:hypothetical protein MD484_g2764, partial [Candolleomyces efflorescens]
MDVGAHCTVSSCNVRDFLPIACKCNNLYCRDHISPDLHLCAAIHEYDPSQSSGLAKLRRCDFEGCNKSSLFAFTAEPERETCDKCRKAFCVDHRYPDTHICIPVEPDNPSASSSSARALLEKNFGSKLSSSSKNKTLSLSKKKVPTDPVKLAQYQKVQLMKMRHSAVPADPKDKGVSLPPDQRLTMNVMYEQTEKSFWFRKSMSTGKAVDLLSTQFKAASSSNPVQLLSSDPTGEITKPLRNDLPLAEQAQDGGTLLLVTTQPE